MDQTGKLLATTPNILMHIEKSEWYQRGSQKPSIEEEQITPWPKDKRTNSDLQNKTLHRNFTTEQHESYLLPRLNSGPPEGEAVQHPRNVVFSNHEADIYATIGRGM